MLRDLVGTEPFWRGIRLYYQRYANGLASTADLRRTMEDVSGRDLRWFFAQWLTRSGVPRDDAVEPGFSPTGADRCWFEMPPTSRPSQLGRRCNYHVD